MVEREEGTRRHAAARDVPRPLVPGEVPEERERIVTGLGELDRVLGGGAVPGSLVLVGGEPGIGKSTLLLQAGGAMARRGVRVLLVSSEESAAQVAARASRVGAMHPELYLLCETDLEAVLESAGELAPDVLVVDSIQTMRLDGVDSPPGGVNQLREAVSFLQSRAKGGGMVVFLVGHVTKEGFLAGPKLVEHMVDCVLYFEGERFDSLRVLRAAKNRFGSVSEVGVFEMGDGGLREVADPSSLFLDTGREQGPGAATAVVMEGRRPLVVEVQSLVVPTKAPSPKRVSTGMDQRRLAVNAAVLERKGKVKLFDRDVYAGISGGFRVTEPAVDLAVCMAVASSRLDRPLPPRSVFLGEVGLTGAVRPVSRMEERVREAVRLGFRRFFLSGRRGVDVPAGIELITVDDVSEALNEAGLRDGKMM
jgi:DNA repair protein RadA/Sms